MSNVNVAPHHTAQSACEHARHAVERQAGKAKLGSVLFPARARELANPARCDIRHDTGFASNMRGKRWLATVRLVGGSSASTLRMMNVRMKRK